jgi:hypothetical protein
MLVMDGVVRRRRVQREEMEDVNNERGTWRYGNYKSKPVVDADSNTMRWINSNNSRASKPSQTSIIQIAKTK